ncbi:DUF2834 domain-containing protein [Solimonas aquatica]|uniref:DUF2834 domain-containing protein n=1 Tax=Solimonas aquatica TaxID=489703 RepID=UPI001C43175B|nr:DUF2834 domain-containing protein [Solimonas aquatica]
MVVATIGLAFAAAFVWIVIPPLLQHPDILGAFAAGFVNPYSSGYALDAICCWLVLAAWVAYEAKAEGIRHGWIALVLGLAPGVATGFAFYLLLRMRRRGTTRGHRRQAEDA